MLGCWLLACCSAAAWHRGTREERVWLGAAVFGKAPLSLGGLVPPHFTCGIAAVPDAHPAVAAVHGCLYTIKAVVSVDWVGKGWRRSQGQD